MRQFLLPLVVIVCAVQATGSAQSPTAPGASPPLATAIERAATAVQAAQSPGAGVDAVAAANDALAALAVASGNQPERDLYRMLAEHAKATAGVGPLTDLPLAGIREHVVRLRLLGHQDRLLPALLLLTHADPGDELALYCLAEAYAIDSPGFDAERAAACYGQLDARLSAGATTGSDDGRRRRLSDLAEIAIFGTLPGRDARDAVAWLRDMVAGFRSQLLQGPIAPDALASPLLTDLQLELAQARAEGAQARCQRLLESLRRLQPIAPVHCLALAHVHASWGKAFDPNRCAALLEEFLRLTGPLIAARDAAHGDREAVARNLAEYETGVTLDSLDATRESARSLLADMRQKNAKRRLLAPDKASVTAEARRLANEAKAKDREVARLDKKLSNLQETLAQIEATPDDRNDPDRKHQALAAAKTAINNVNRLLTDAQSAADTTRAELAALDAWLAAH